MRETVLFLQVVFHGPAVIPLLFQHTIRMKNKQEGFP